MVTITTSASVAERQLQPADIAQLVEREFSKLKVSSSVSVIYKLICKRVLNTNNTTKNRISMLASFLN